MSNLNAIPLSYTTPQFPSLYWPFRTDPNEPKYLYTLHDIWKFTLYWTLITIPLAHLVVALWAIFMQFLSANERARYIKLHSSSKTSRTRGSATRHRHRHHENHQENESEEDSERSSDDNGNNNERSSAAAEKSPQNTKQQSTAEEKPRPRRRLTAKHRRLLGASPLKSTFKYAGLILAVYVVLGAIEALIAGSLVGLVLGAVYNAGYFRMSVWTPLFWGIINMLVLILASFRISGGM